MVSLIKKCLHCGKEFETKNPQKLYCNDQHYRPCPVCGKPVAMIDNDFSRPAKCCSNECSKILRQQKFAERICTECGQSFTPRSGMQQICDRKHTRMCKICGNEFEVSRRDIQDNIVVCCHECSLEFARQKKILNCRAQNEQSNNYIEVDEQIKRRIEFGDKLDVLKINYSFDKQIEDTMFDICLPDSKTLIKVSPSYTYNIVGDQQTSGIAANYPLQKTKLAERHEYRCVHLFDWDDLEKVANLFQPRIRMYARDCQIYRINLPAADDFLNKYHLQGTCRGQLLCLGLVKDDVLYQIMTFGKARYDKRHDIELLRLCTRTGYSIVGGAGKLFSYATSEYALNNIISYCDISKFSGHVYENIGMQLISILPPQIIWSKQDKFVEDKLLRQCSYNQLFKTAYDKETSDEELMLKHSWLPVPDCGKRVFEYSK